MCESMSHSKRVRYDARPTGPSEKIPFKCRAATGVAMTIGMTMVLPPSHSFTQWGRLCQNGSWGEIPVRRCGKPPLDDFPLRVGVSGTNRLCKYILSKDVISYFVSLSPDFQVCDLFT